MGTILSKRCTCRFLNGSEYQVSSVKKCYEVICHGVNLVSPLQRKQLGAKARERVSQNIRRESVAKVYNNDYELARNLDLDYIEF